MFDRNKISLQDITSESVEGFEYIKDNEAYMKNYNEYEPDSEKLDTIKELLKLKNNKMIFRAFGASWCGDCVIQIPRLIKIAKIIGDGIFEVRVFANIKVKAPYDRVKGELIWKSPPSPPETLDKRFDMFHIPAIFLFSTEGNCIGKIDEKPEHTPTLEGDIIHHLQN